MRRGDALKEFIAGTSDLNIMIEIDNDLNMIPAETAVRIWEYLNEQTGEEKKQKKEEPKQEQKPKKLLDTPKMVALRKAGWTYEKIADEMGCSPQTVINHIKKVTE